MVRSLGCQHIYLDHLTIISSGLAQDTRHLDSLITKIRSFIAATKCTVFAISHLSRQQGQNFENGDVPELQAIRSSHSIVQLADTIWALGRKRGSNDTTSHCLKNRMLGRTGYSGHFTFEEKNSIANSQMGRPGNALTEWSEVSVGDVVHFFTGAGWKKGTIQKNTGNSVQILHSHGSNDKRITTSDLRNLRSQAGSTRGELPPESDGSSQPELFN